MTIVSPLTLYWDFSLSPSVSPRADWAAFFVPDPKYSRCIRGQNNSLRVSIHAFLAQGRAVSTHPFLLPDSCLRRPVYVNSAACVSTYTLTHISTLFPTVLFLLFQEVMSYLLIMDGMGCGDGENCLINVLRTRHGEKY